MLSLARLLLDRVAGIDLFDVMSFTHKEMTEFILDKFMKSYRNKRDFWLRRPENAPFRPDSQVFNGKFGGKLIVLNFITLLRAIDDVQQLLSKK